MGWGDGVTCVAYLQAGSVHDAYLPGGELAAVRSSDGNAPALDHGPTLVPVTNFDM